VQYKQMLRIHAYSSWLRLLFIPRSLTLPLRLLDCFCSWFQPLVWAQICFR